MNRYTLKVYEHIGESLYCLLGDDLLTTAILNDNIADLLGDLDIKLREMRLLNLLPEIVWRFKPQIRQMILCFYAAKVSEAIPNLEISLIRDNEKEMNVTFSFYKKGENRGKVVFSIFKGDWKIKIENPTGHSSTLIAVQEANVKGMSSPESNESVNPDQDSSATLNESGSREIQQLTEDEVKSLLK